MTHEEIKLEWETAKKNNSWNENYQITITKKNNIQIKSGNVQVDSLFEDSNNGYLMNLLYSAEKLIQEKIKTMRFKFNNVLNIMYKAKSAREKDKYLNDLDYSAELYKNLFSIFLNKEIQKLNTTKVFKEYDFIDACEIIFKKLNKDLKNVMFSLDFRELAQGKNDDKRLIELFQIHCANKYFSLLEDKATIEELSNKNKYEKMIIHPILKDLEKIIEFKLRPPLRLVVLNTYFKFLIKLIEKNELNNFETTETLVLSHLKKMDLSYQINLLSQSDTLETTILINTLGKDNKQIHLYNLILGQNVLNKLERLEQICDKYDDKILVLLDDLRYTNKTNRGIVLIKNIIEDVEDNFFVCRLLDKNNNIINENENKYPHFLEIVPRESLNNQKSKELFKKGIDDIYNFMNKRVIEYEIRSKSKTDDKKIFKENIKTLNKELKLFNKLMEKDEYLRSKNKI